MNNNTKSDLPNQPKQNFTQQAIEPMDQSIRSTRFFYENLQISEPPNSVPPTDSFRKKSQVAESCEALT